ncbi:MAG: DDE transposase [Burkholderiales bacterium PBB3]|nr:MAG: DDE transposase [Burkholderiales bacterium PBB3]
MPRYKPQDHNSLLLPVVLSEQIIPGSFAFALNYLVDHELDLAPLDAQFKNDEVGASAYDPRVMLKIVLLAYSQGIISSRGIEQTCARNVQFIAISGDSQPSHTHIAKFVCSLSDQIKPLFAQVLITCDAQGLIGRDMFAIDGVKLPSNASKERSGTHAELRHRADRLDKAADKIISLHQAQDKQGATEALEPKRQAQMEALRKEAARTREFLNNTPPRQNRKGDELKTNVTDPQSAKMATNKGVIQGYAGQAAVDSAHQVIVAADVIGSGSEQAMLLPMIEQSQPYREEHTLITADAGYHSDANIAHLNRQNIPAMVADNQMRSRDERFENQDKYKANPDPLALKKATGQPKEVKRFGPKDFTFNDDNTATCPAGQTMKSPGTIHTTARGLDYQNYTARAVDCNNCELSKQCLKGPLKPNDGRGRQVTRFVPKQKDPTHPSERMRQAIDSPRGRQLYSQRIGTVEPVFANIRHNKRLSRFNHRGREKVNTQWNLYCMVHNIEKLSKTKLGYQVDQ